MKKLISSALFCFLLTLSFHALASKNPYLKPTDTLKKTSKYLLISKSENVNEVFISRNKKSKDQVLYLKIGFMQADVNSNTVKTAILQGDKQYGEAKNPTISNVKILKGKYADMKAEAASKTATLYTLTNLEFPLHLAVEFMGESLDFELLEPGKWDIDVNLKK